MSSGNLLIKTLEFSLLTIQTMFVGLLATLAAFFSPVLAGVLPAGIVTCKRKDPNINDCLKSAIQESLEVLHKGVESLNLEVLDPLHIDNLVIDRKKDDGSPVDVDLEWHDATITGVRSAKITSAKADWDNGMISFESEFSEPVKMTGTYTVDGMVLILPISGKGKFDVELEGFKPHIKIHGHEEDKAGEKYFIVDKLAYTFEISHMTINYSNLFNGDPTLGQSMNNFMNENWKDILQELTPAIEASFSSHFQVVAKNFFERVPMSEIAPE